MTFLSPRSFYFLAAAALLILLSFLRSRSRRRPVSALSLWAGLTETPEPRSLKLHRWLDPLLFLQLAVLALLVLAMVQPMFRKEKTVFRGIALVLDASASMHTVAENGRTRYDLAVDRAIEILDGSSSSQIALIQFASQSAVLVAPTDDEDEIVRALKGSQPLWCAGGDASGLIDLFSAVGGLEDYDRVVLLTDSVPADLPAGIDVELFQQGENVGITAFTVRENLEGPGASAFVELSNGTDAYLEPKLTIRDEFSGSTFSFLLGPMSREQYVVPLPASRGTRFTAALDGDDDYPFDNQRFFALARPSSLRVHWIGNDNRFLLAGLESVLPLRLVPEDEPADLTIVVGETIEALPEGNLLLVHTEILGQIRLSAPQAGGFAMAAQVDHPLLLGIDPADIYLETLPATEFFIPAEPLLVVNDLPFVTDASTGERLIVVLSTDLTATNFPITVDFPLLLRNLIAIMQRLPSPLVHEWRTVGQLIDAQQYGSVAAAETPNGDEIVLSVGQLAIPTDQPGFYVLKTRDETVPVAVNIDPGESARPGMEEVHGVEATGRTETQEMLLRLWPYFAIAALLLLLTEAIVYVRSELTEKGVR